MSEFERLFEKAAFALAASGNYVDDDGALNVELVFADAIKFAQNYKEVLDGLLSRNYREDGARPDPDPDCGAGAGGYEVNHGQ